MQRSSERLLLSSPDQNGRPLTSIASKSTRYNWKRTAAIVFQCYIYISESCNRKGRQSIIAFVSSCSFSHIHAKLSINSASNKNDSPRLLIISWTGLLLSRWRMCQASQRLLVVRSLTSGFFSYYSILYPIKWHPGEVQSDADYPGNQESHSSRNLTPEPKKRRTLMDLI